MIVGIVVVLAVTLTQFRQLVQSGGEFFPGMRGLLAIPTLAIAAGLLAMMGSANVELLKGRTIVFGVAVGLVALIASALRRSSSKLQRTAGHGDLPTERMTSSPIISIRSVTKRFPGVVALADVSLDVRPGELHAICGENGAGKSTLMKILSGVITDYEGELLLARQAGAIQRHARRRSGGHQHHPSGAEPGRAAFGRRQYLSGPRNPRLAGPARRPGDGAGRGAAAERAGMRDRPAAARPAACASAISSSSRSPRPSRCKATS